MWTVEGKQEMGRVERRIGITGKKGERTTEMYAML